MNELKSELGLVKNIFPVHHLVIDELYASDNDFMSLCGDLFLCSKIITDLQSEIDEKTVAMNEYRNIVRDLENDLLITISSARL